MTDRDIMPADPEYRKKVIRIFILASVLGFLLLALMVPKMDELSSLQNPKEALKWVMALMIFLSLIPILLTALLIRIAYLTLRQKQFPPEGVKVMRDTPILYDEDAKKRAYVILFIAVLIIDACVFIAIIGVNLIGTLL